LRKLEKADIVQGIKEKVAQSRISILTDFTGLKVEDMTRLRRQLQEVNGQLTVVKNTLMVRAAADESALAPLISQFTGPNAITLGYEDPVALTKVLMKFAQERPQFKIKAGVLAGQFLSPQDLDALAKLPSREVLLSQFLGLLKGVPTALVTVLSGVIRNLLTVLVALKDKKAEAEPAAAAVEVEAAVVAEVEAAAPAEVEAEVVAEAAAEVEAEAPAEVEAKVEAEAAGEGEPSKED
jgi:large subunit ribosomal protein L10